MSLNFLKWQQGIADWKQNLGLMLLLFAISLVLIWRGKTDREGEGLAICGGILALAVFVPVTAVSFLMGYTGFYDWTDLQLLIPFTPALALGGCLAVEKLSGTRGADTESEGVKTKTGTAAAKKAAIRKVPAAAAAVSVIFLILAVTNFHAFDGQEQSDGYGIPSEACAVYASLGEILGEGEATILAERELLQYVRLYCTDWYPAYGRDIWDSHAAGYVEYTYGAKTTEVYEILARTYLTEEDAATLVSYVEESRPDCLIVPWYWEAELEELSDYNLVTLTEQYIGYVNVRISR